MKILLLLGDFGVPSLSRRLLSSQHKPIFVVLSARTEPPARVPLRERIKAHLRPTLWPGTLSPLPPDFRPWTIPGRLKAWDVPFAREENLSASDYLHLIEQHSIDLVLSVGHPRILPATVLQAAPRGGVNVHPSLLPLYRGPSPVFWQIVQGEAESGVTIHRMTGDVDAGPILLQVKTRIGPRETAGHLSLRLARLTASLLPEALGRLEAGALAERRPASSGSWQPRLRLDDAWIDWSRPASELSRLVRACSPYPGARTCLPNGECLTVWSARVKDQSETAPSGKVVGSGSWFVDVAAGSGLVRILAATSDRGHRLPGWGRPWLALVPGTVLLSKAGRAPATDVNACA